MMQEMFRWLFDHPWAAVLAGLPLGYGLRWMPGAGKRLVAMIVLAATPMLAFLISGNLDGCIASEAKASCLGWAIAMVLMIVLITPLWIGSLGGGMLLRHWQERRRG